MKFIDKSSLSKLGTYVYGETNINKITVQAGVRSDQTKIKIETSERLQFFRFYIRRQ